MEHLFKDVKIKTHVSIFQKMEQMKLFLNKHLPRNITYKELCKHAGIYQQTLSRWNTTEGNPNLHMLKVLCMALEKFTEKTWQELVLDYYENHV